MLLHCNGLALTLELSGGEAVRLERVVRSCLHELGQRNAAGVL